MNVKKATAEIFRFYEKAWRDSRAKNIGAYQDKIRGVGTRLQQTEFMADKCIAGCCDLCNICGIAVVMKRLEQLRAA